MFIFLVLHFEFIMIELKFMINFHLEDHLYSLIMTDLQFIVELFLEFTFFLFENLHLLTMLLFI